MPITHERLADIHLSIGACAHEVTEEEEEGGRESEAGGGEGEGSGVGIRRGGGDLWRRLSKRFTKCFPSLMGIGKNRLKSAINITKKENAKERSTVVIICLKNGPGELSRDFCCIVSRR